MVGAEPSEKNQISPPEPNDKVRSAPKAFPGSTRPVSIGNLCPAAQARARKDGMGCPALRAKKARLRGPDDPPGGVKNPRENRTAAFPANPGNSFHPGATLPSQGVHPSLGGFSGATPPKSGMPPAASSMRAGFPESPSIPAAAAPSREAARAKSAPSSGAIREAPASSDASVS